MKFKIGDKVKIVATKEELKSMGINTNVDMSKIYTILDMNSMNCLLNTIPINYWYDKPNLVCADRENKLKRILYGN